MPIYTHLRRQHKAQEEQQHRGERAAWPRVGVRRSRGRWERGEREAGRDWGLQRFMRAVEGHRQVNDTRMASIDPEAFMSRHSNPLWRARVQALVNECEAAELLMQEDMPGMTANVSRCPACACTSHHPFICLTSLTHLISIYPHDRWPRARRCGGSC